MRAVVAALMLLGSVRVRAADEPFRLSLSGDPATATRFDEEEVGVVPFGGWLNAIPLQTVQHGVQFSAELEWCAPPGCILTTEDSTRVLIAKKDVADAVRIPLYDDGWMRSGTSALSEENRIAVPVVGPSGRREIWVLRNVRGEWRLDRGARHGRYPHSVEAPLVLRWRDEDLFLRYRQGDREVSQQLRLETGALVTATPIEPYWYHCVGGAKDHWAVGPLGENLEGLQGEQTLPIWRRGDPRPGVVELTGAVRPQAASGFASPMKAQFDCLGRLAVVSSIGDDIWCLRFGPDGAMQNGVKVGANVAGSWRSVQLDQRGRFYVLAVEMKDDQMTPKLIHLIRYK